MVAVLLPQAGAGCATLNFVGEHYRTKARHSMNDQNTAYQARQRRLGTTPLLSRLGFGAERIIHDRGSVQRTALRTGEALHVADSAAAAPRTPGTVGGSACRSNAPESGRTNYGLELT